MFEQKRFIYLFDYRIYLYDKAYFKQMVATLKSMKLGTLKINNYIVS